jgi:hypothetical protein
MYTRYHFRPQFGRFISLLICGALLVSIFVATPRSSAKSPRKTKTTAPVVNPQGNSQRQRQPLPRDNSRRVDPIQPDRVGRPINLPSVDELKRRKPEKPEAPAPVPSTTRSPRKRAGNNKPVAATSSPDRVVLSADQTMNGRARSVIRAHHARLANVAMPQGPSNVALNKPATQSSTLAYNPPGDASHAVDGNTDGNYFHASVTHTNGGNQEWWQVDLGASYSLQTINVWNRTDCCGDRLSNFYVLVSDNPFVSTDLTATLSQSGVSNYYTAGQGGTPTTLNINRTGRYVRVQLAGSGVILSLAEVEVFGTAAGSGGASASERAVARLDPFNQPGNQLQARDCEWSLPLVSLPGRSGLDLGLTLHIHRWSGPVPETQSTSMKTMAIPVPVSVLVFPPSETHSLIHRQT